MKYPILNEEFNHRFFDADVVAAVISEYKITRNEWEKYSLKEQVLAQIDFVSPPPLGCIDGVMASQERWANIVVSEIEGMEYTITLHADGEDVVTSFPEKMFAQAQLLVVDYMTNKKSFTVDFE